MIEDQMKSSTDQQGHKKIFLFGNRYWMTLYLLLTDAVSLFIAVTFALFIWSKIRPELHPSYYVPLIPLLVIFLVIFAIAGLYPAIGLSPVDELRRLAVATTLVFFIIAALTFWERNALSYSRAAFIISWFLSLIILPVSRKALRTILSNAGFWGEPVVIIGMGHEGQKILSLIMDNPQLGMRPLAVIQDDSGNEFPLPKGIMSFTPKQIGGFLAYAKQKGVRSAILIPIEIPRELNNQIMNDQILGFPHLIVFYLDQTISNLWVAPFDLDGNLGLEIKKNLLFRRNQVLKRVIELGIILLLSIFIIPIFLLISALIVIDNPGKVFYKQTRIGRGGKEFFCWKFRTMRTNSESLLRIYLDMHPEQNKEYETFRKLKQDPRITRFGKILRRFSLDELPQIFNILKGEMALVGPRPIMANEVSLYNNDFKTYLQVNPGLTGLWQVSGRANLPFDQRVKLDEYYLRNWSIWMDVYVLGETFFALISGRGAY